MPCLVWRHTKTYPGKAQPCQVPAGCPRGVARAIAIVRNWEAGQSSLYSLGASASTVSICPQLMHLKMHRSGSGPPFAALPENFISRPHPGHGSDLNSTIPAKNVTCDIAVVPWAPRAALRCHRPRMCEPLQHRVSGDPGVQSATPGRCRRSAQAREHGCYLGPLGPRRSALSPAFGAGRSSRCRRGARALLNIDRGE